MGRDELSAKFRTRDGNSKISLKLMLDSAQSTETWAGALLVPPASENHTAASLSIPECLGTTTIITSLRSHLSGMKRRIIFTS